MKSTEEILESRLEEIELNLIFLRKERIKTKKNLLYFRNKEPNKDPFIKEKIKITLTEKYPYGATTNKILTYINKKWKKQIKIRTLSSTLSQLKQEETFRKIRNVSNQPVKQENIFILDDDGRWLLIDDEYK